MKKIKIMIMAVAAAVMIFAGAHDVMAREGGGERGGDEGRGGEGERAAEGERGQLDHRHRHNNYYENEGWWGEDDSYTNEDNQDIVVEPPPGDVFQDSTPAAASVGAQVATLPPGSEGKIVGGKQFYKNGDTWYKPYFGASGVYYEVVSPPNE